MPKSIAGAYAVAGAAIAVAIIVVASSTVGLFGGPPPAGAVGVATQPGAAQSAQAIELSTGTVPEGNPAVAVESGGAGEREHEEYEEHEEHEGREGREGREEGEEGEEGEHAGFLSFFRGDDD